MASDPRRVAACGLVAAVLAGCGPPPPAFAPATGRVTLDGRPLAGVVVRFFPDPDAHGRAGPVAMGETDDDGRFELNSVTGVRGVVVATHRVTVAEPEPEPPLPAELRGQAPPRPRPKRKPGEPPRFPPVYTDLAKTPLPPVEVRPDQPHFDLDLQSAAGR